MNPLLGAAPRRCANPLCSYLLIGGAKYCCDGCATADTLGYEAHEDGFLGHSAACARRVLTATSETSVWFA